MVGPDVIEPPLRFQKYQCSRATIRTGIAHEARAYRKVVRSRASLVRRLFMHRA